MAYKKNSRSRHKTERLFNENAIKHYITTQLTGANNLQPPRKRLRTSLSNSCDS